MSIGLIGLVQYLIDRSAKTHSPEHCQAWTSLRWKDCLPDAEADTASHFFDSLNRRCAWLGDIVTMSLRCQIANAKATVMVCWPNQSIEIDVKDFRFHQFARVRILLWLNDHGCNGIIAEINGERSHWSMIPA